MIPLPGLKGLAAKALLGLGLAALLAFGAGYFVSRVRAVYEDGVKAGRTEMALEQREAVDKARQAAEAALAARDAETALRLAAAEARAGEAEKARNLALATLRQSDAALNRCLALPYPDSVRAHRPVDPGVRDGA